MKIAVLISGELRTFDKCRRSMGFLNDSQVTVFVSTWRKSENTNSVLKINHTFSTSEEEIKSILGDVKIGGIRIEDTNQLTDARYNSSMIHRWIEGLDMISDDFDLIIVLRPDLFFNSTANILTSLKPAVPAALKFVNSYDLRLGKLQDIMFSGKPKTLKRIVNSKMLSEWNNSPNHDWHTWFYSYVRPKLLDIQCVGWMVHWGRPNMGCNPTYEDVVYSAEVWRDSIIWNQLNTLGIEQTNDIWGREMVARVKNLAEDGFFERYALSLRMRPRDEQTAET